ncbi:MAG: hypothetical protein JSU72_13395 [Deltaproteobacteria bacterium]|nr:MAG: hypothetical protein JSU72_13395 [Deltaproteobacteria bacterium]
MKQDRDSSGRFLKLHGADCKQIRNKYFDGRTKEGKLFHAIRRNMIGDLGGEASLSQKQWILLDRVLEKLIFLHRVGEWSLEQDCIVDAKGELLPCLGKSYIAFNNALRLDLQALYGDSDNAKKRTPKISEIIAEHKG